MTILERAYRTTYYQYDADVRIDAERREDTPITITMSPVQFARLLQNIEFVNSVEEVNA